MGKRNGPWCQERFADEPAPTKTAARLLMEERFWWTVDKSGECWVWTGARNNVTGYGSLAWPKKNKSYAHRVSYEIAYGPIPEGMVIDHRCRNRACVRPEHLRACTQKQNCENRRGANRDSKTGIQGVWWDSRARRWKATVKHAGRFYHCGTFETAQEADAAALAKRLELFTHNDLDRIRQASLVKTAQ